MADTIVVSRPAIRALIRLARRVDAGETSWLDVLHGRDPSPDAGALRRSAEAAVSSLVDELAEQDPDLARRMGRNPGGSTHEPTR